MTDDIRKASTWTFDRAIDAPPAPAAVPGRASRARADSRMTFFREFLRHPDEIGSVIPSSRFLERRLVEIAGVESARVVVELGPGTGGTSRAILAALRADAHLLAIEINARFASLLRAVPDPRLVVHSGSAADIAEALVQHGLAAPDAILSGIPFSTMPAPLGRRILAAAWAALAPGGRFVAYQFRGSVAALGRELAGPPEVAVELRNAPPVRVYSWRKPPGRVSSA